MSPRVSIICALGAAAIAAVAASGEMSGVWRTGAPLERPRAALGAVAIGANVYVAGGSTLLSPASDFDVYESGLGQWRELAPLPEGRARFGMASLNGKIYVAGGAASEGEAIASAVAYDPGRDAWDPISDLPGPRAGHALVAVQGKLYAVGGATAAVDVYDLAERRWTRLAGSAELARFGAAAVEHEGELYLIGGRLGEAASARVDAYDPVRDAWRNGPDLPAPRAGLAAAVVDGQLHVLGGSNAAGLDAANDHWVLNADGMGWGSAPELPAPRADFAAAAADGRLVIVGGGAGGGFYGPFTAAPAVDLFEPAG
jgi:N-acetylneuraminic acid mutarotase